MVMALDAQLTADVAAIRSLRDGEARLREAARALELVPDRWDDARRLFTLASAVRSERMELVSRCGLA